MNGILIIDKPAGLTSHDVVARVRRLLKEKRVGHTGTLDPFATGVLVVLVGRATRLAQFQSGADKEYEAVIRFGYATDTGDATGTVREESRATLTAKEFAGAWDEARIVDALSRFRGIIEQVPPMYSAKKVEGRKLYELARKGQVIERTAVNIIVHEFEPVLTNGDLLKYNSNGTCDLAVRVVCSAGTYLRTLAESVGEQLSVGAHLSALRRTRAGNFHLSTAQTLAQLDEHVKLNDDLNSVMLPMRAALTDMTSILLEGEVASRVRNGAVIESDVRFLDGEFVQMCDSSGELIAVGTYNLELGSLHPRVVLA